MWSAASSNNRNEARPIHSANHLRGLPSTRYIRALGVGQGRLTEALAFAAGQDWRNTPEVMRALQTPLDSSSGAALLPETRFVERSCMPLAHKIIEQEKRIAQLEARISELEVR